MRARIATVLTGLALALTASPARPAPEVPGPRADVHALVGARVVTRPGRVLDNATVVVRDGLVEAVGVDLASPPDARVWDLEGRTVYAAFIESYSALSWPDEEEADAPATGHPNPFVRPERSVVDRLGSFEPGKLRAAGFGTAVVVPEGGIFAGASAIVALGDGEPGVNVILPRSAQAAALESRAFGDGYPTSQMGAIALFRQTVLDATWYRQAHAAWAANPAQARPVASTALAELGAVAAGEAPLVLATRDPRESLKARALADELGLDLVLLGHGREYHVVDQLAASGLALLLPLDFPDTPQAGDEDDLSLDLADLRHWRDAPGNAGRLLEAGATVALTSHGLGTPNDLHEAVRRAIEEGSLKPEDALAALTTTPAALLGLERILGTIEPGKMAQLLEVEGDLFAEEAHLVAVWVDGRRYEVKSTEAATVEPAGTWELTVETGDGQEIPTVLELTGDAESLDGSLRIGEQVMRLSSVSVSGAEVTLALDTTAIGIPGTTTMTLTLDGDQARGGGLSPAGPFDVRGRRTAGPEEV